MRRLPSALLLLAVPALLRAQTTVRGTVVDARTGAPIAGASVVVTGTGTGTATAADGAFTLASGGAIPSITVTSLGYATTTVAVSDASQVLHVSLTPAPVQLPGIEVTAQAPTPSAETLTPADLRRASGLRLTDAINAVPGVFMQSRTPWGGARITIRGYYPSTGGNSPNSNGLGYAVFLNDIPMTDAAGVTVLDAIDYSQLGRVEVVKGPASSRYGSAIGGTVRLTAASPPPGETGLAQQVLVGNDGLRRTTTTFASATAASDLVVSYGHQQYDSFRPHSASSKEYVRASGDFGAGNRQRLSVYFSYSRSYEELAGEIDSADFYARRAVSNVAYLANDAHIQLSAVVAGLTDHYQLSDRFSNRTTLFVTGRTSGQPFAHGFTDANQVNFGARSELGFAGTLGGTGITGFLGALVQRSNVTTNGVFIIPAPPYPERPTAQENYATALSVYTEWSAALPGRLTLTAGASLNLNTFAIHNMLVNNQLFDTTTVEKRSFPPVLTPRAVVAKQVSRHASLYASVSAGYTPPLLSNTVANDGTVNLALRPERAVQYELGMQGAWFGGRLTLEADVFDVENTDKLVSQTSGGVTFTTNVGRQRDRGAELALSCRILDDPARAVSLLRPWVSYAFTQSRFVDFRSNNNRDSTTVDYSGNAVPRVPRHTVTAGVDLGTRQGLSLHATWRHVDRVPVTFDNSTWVRGYGLLGAQLSYEGRVATHWRMRAFAGGDNLLGNTYFTFLFVGADYASLAQPADGGSGDGYIIPGPYAAAFYGSLSLRYAF